MATPTQIISLPVPCTASQIVVQGGVTPIPTDEIQGTPAVYPAVSTIGGWSLSESTGVSAAKVRLYDGISTAGRLIATIGLLAGGTNNRDYDFPPELLNNGIYLQVVSGSVEGSIQFG